MLRGINFAVFVGCRCLEIDTSRIYLSQRSVSLFEEVRRRIPQLTESYQRLITQYQQLHSSNTADAANTAMAVEVC